VPAPSQEMLQILHQPTKRVYCFAGNEKLVLSSGNRTMKLNNQLEVQYRQTLEELESIKAIDDVTKLRDWYTRFIKEWYGKGKYFHRLAIALMQTINTMNSIELDKGMLLKKEVAEKSLDQENDLPLKVAFDALIIMIYDQWYWKEKLNAAEWKNYINWLIQHCRNAKNQLEAAIDERFDFTDLPQKNIEPPLETGLPSGVAPEEIKDPDLRVKYEADIECNRQKTESYTNQLTLRNLREYQLPILEGFLSSNETQW
jgi:hypothetical protein